MDAIIWEKCTGCNRPKVCSSNLWKLRGLCGVGVVGSAALGFFALPIFGFGAGGVIGGSAAAAWQSTIGNVAAGSLFAILQSLGAGIGPLLFGSVGTGLGLLGTLAVKLDWCDEEKAGLRIMKVKRQCGDGCVTTYPLRIAHIKNLDVSAPLSQNFEQGGIAWTLTVKKVYSEQSAFFAIELQGNKECKIRAIVRISSKKKRVQRVENHTEVETDSIRINDVIPWNELLRPENKFVEENYLHGEIEIADGKYFPRFVGIDKTVKQKASSVWDIFSSKTTNPTLEITDSHKTCQDGCVTTLQLTVSNVKKLLVHQHLSKTFKQRDIRWKLEVFRDISGYFRIEFTPDKSCKTRIVISNVSSLIENVISRDVEANKKLPIDIMLWEHLIDSKQKFIEDSSFTFKVEITDGLYLQDPKDEAIQTEDVPIKLECKICQKNIPMEGMSTLPCGHPFCSECIKWYVKGTGQCKICKTRATLESIRHVIVPK